MTVLGTTPIPNPSDSGVTDRRLQAIQLRLLAIQSPRKQHGAGADKIHPGSNGQQKHGKTLGKHQGFHPSFKAECLNI